MTALTTVRPEFLPSGPTPPAGSRQREEAPSLPAYLQLQAALLAAACVKLTDPGRILA